MALTPRITLSIQITHKAKLMTALIDFAMTSNYTNSLKNNNKTIKASTTQDWR